MGRSPSRPPSGFLQAVALKSRPNANRQLAALGVRVLILHCGAAAFTLSFYLSRSLCRHYSYRFSSKSLDNRLVWPLFRLFYHFIGRMAYAVCLNEIHASKKKKTPCRTLKLGSESSLVPQKAKRYFWAQEMQRALFIRPVSAGACKTPIKRMEVRRGKEGRGAALLGSHRLHAHPHTPLLRSKFPFVAASHTPPTKSPDAHPLLAIVK